MVDLHILEFPLSLIMAIAIVLAVFVIPPCRVRTFMESKALGAVLFSVASLLLVIEGTWGMDIHRHWAFAALVLLMLLSLGLNARRDFAAGRYTALFAHVGFFMVLAGGVFGAADRIDVHMKLYAGAPAEHVAVTKQGEMFPLPFDISLESFTTEYYQDGTSPKQYTSTLLADGKRMQTGVNHPCRFKGYSIYQYGGDLAGGSYSVLKLVRDPWLYLVALGALLMALSTVISLMRTWGGWKLVVAMILLAAVFTAVSVARINFGTLMPALRSLWFVPHLIVYMLAYSLMTLSVAAAFASAFVRKIPSSLSIRLLSTSSALLLAGMLCGAFWANAAWGDYWTWDPKECWAAVTWLLALGATHAPRRKQALVFTLLAFLAIQMTWYGVNYLPSAQDSLHTYNSK